MCKARKDYVGCSLPDDCNSCVHPCGFTPEEIKDIEQVEAVTNETGCTPRQLADQKKALLVALKKYGDHLGGCYQNLRMGECNCGYLTAIAAATD